LMPLPIRDRSKFTALIVAIAASLPVLA